MKDEHHYFRSTDTPRRLERKIDEKSELLEKARKMLEVEKQRVRSMRKQVRSMKEVIEALQKQLLISTNAAQHLSDEFSGPVLSLLTRTAKNWKSADKEAGSKSPGKSMHLS